MDMTVTPADIRRVLDEHPQLSAHGLRPPRSVAAQFDMSEMRSYLTDERGLDEVQRCVDWFSTAELNAKAYDDSPSSYSVKHVVEAQPPRRYVSNGAAVVAALLCGVPIHDDGSPNPGLGLNRRWYDAEHDRVMNA